MAKPKKTRSRKPAAFINDPLWYKDAVIYQVHVKSFYDSNNDGIGDFPGLIDKLDYIAGLGVNTIWILPFYPSPRRDDGYDISEYRGVHPDYGTMADARRFIAEAHKRGLRVITELVINHTSSDHPWFQRARKAKKGSSARNFYVWSNDDKKYDGTRIIFLDTEKSNWTWDPVAEQYYWHRFYSHQPDLNFDNPQVMKAVISIMRYWLDMGVDGLRLDAIPYLVERDGTNNENLPETHAVLKQIRAEIDANYPDRMLLAEANQWPEDTQQYFGEGDECHMAFHFPLMPRMYMAIAQEDRFPISDILRQTPEIPANCQWSIFLRNHDELTLEMVTDRERDYLWNFYASDRRARINLGIRRRLAPLLERDRRRIELLNSLLLSMPGTPTMYYGDEIGMGDNIHLGDRDGVRTPMQWSVDRNGGFSRADPASLVLPVVMDPLYGYQSINVESQARDPHSLLNWTRRMLAVRKQQKAFGRGTMKMLRPTNRRILAYLRDYTTPEGEHETILCVANVSRAAQAVELDLSSMAGKVPVEMLGGSAFPPIGQLPYMLTLQPYGFYWFYLAGNEQMPAWHSEPPETMPDFQTLVIKKNLQELLSGTPRKALEQEILPLYLPKRRWFGSKDEAIQQVTLMYAVEIPTPKFPVLFMEVCVKNAKGQEHYALPLGFLAESDQHCSPLATQLAMSRIRHVRNVGLVTDAFTLTSFVHGVFKAFKDQAVLKSPAGEIRFQPYMDVENFTTTDETEIRHMGVEQSNSSLIVGDKYMLKLIRKVATGIHPEVEMGRFLTDKGFANMAPLLGEVTRYNEEGTPNVLMLVQPQIHNQGDAWKWTLDKLDQVTRDMLEAGLSEVENEFTAMSDLENFAAILGQRLGEMHTLLAQDTDDAAFAPEKIDADSARTFAHRVREQVDAALDTLENKRASLDNASTQHLDKLVSQRKELGERIEALAEDVAGGLRIRVHGDLHLGQVLVSQDDAYLIDFEGEPARSLDERRAKYGPHKDVAGLLRSFDYAAAMITMSSNSGADTSEEAMRQRRQAAETYRTTAYAAFLKAYREAAAGIAHEWSERGEQAALDLYTLEKAVYEIGYEAANRPNWINIPLRGVAAIVDSLISGAKG
ncbi:maltose alpha-D-glucosyltransferase [Pseudomonas luteola]|uniref:maltose alpha-D-glucosyltransferase n=1 Tax=Pseudomonas luteola TaxID=47886 RepID=UPI000F79152A|nr:maltose alpha-D-glucosyltransferase [Pseudomonas luteola]RRW44791.1 maltose alpha-D-glucosyltransferase [Pseudomonas luteola]